MRVGYLFISRFYQLDQIAPLFAMSRPHTVQRNLEVAHVRNVNRPAQTLLFVVHKYAGVSLAEQFTVSGSSAVQGGRERGVLLLR